MIEKDFDLINFVGCLNDIISNAIEHGSDAGGSYSQNMEGLYRACRRFCYHLNCRDKLVIQYHETGSYPLLIGTNGEKRKDYYSGWYFEIKGE